MSFSDLPMEMQRRAVLDQCIAPDGRVISFRWISLTDWRTCWTLNHRPKSWLGNTWRLRSDRGRMVPRHRRLDEHDQDVRKVDAYSFGVWR